LNPNSLAEELHAANSLESTMKEVSTYYCYTVMKYSRYQAPQQDKIFFESFYEFITTVVCAAFAPENKVRIENEMHRILRSQAFNLMVRKNDSEHHTKKNFTSRDLYILRNSGEGSMGRKMLSLLHPRRTYADNVSNALSKRSPLASMLVPQPMQDPDPIIPPDMLALGAAAPRADKQERKAHSCSPTRMRKGMEALSLSSSPKGYQEEKPHLHRSVPFETI
jgi:hypothetical protein